MERIKQLQRSVELPEGVTCTVQAGSYTIAKGEVSLTKEMRSKIIVIEVKDGKIILFPKKIPGGKKEKSIINANASHMKNMIQGVQEPYVYKLKVCSSHFPMTASVKGNEFVVSNFIGEKIDRTLKIKEGATVKVESNIVVVTSPDKTLAGVVAGEIEKLTKRPGFDRRIFMDGIHLIEKAGVELK